MKDKLRKLFNFVLLFIGFAIVSVFVDLFIFNFDILTLDKEDRGSFLINNYSDEIVDGKRIISVDLDDKYVNKFVIDYDTLEDVDVAFYYTGEDYYGEDVDKEYLDVLGFEVDEQVTSLDDHIEEFKIVFEENTDIDINRISIENNIQINYFRIIYFVAFMLIVYIIYTFYKRGAKDDKIHIYFFIIGLIIGGVMIILQPAGTYYSWDDETHFSSAYQLVGGVNRWTVGETTMIDVSYAWKRNISTLEEQENRYDYVNTEDYSEHSSSSSRFITYNKIAYIPSAIGYHLCKFVNLPFVICFKMGKIMNLLTYLFMMSLAIKLSNNGKRILSVIGFIPSSIFLACQYSCDYAVIGGITLGVVCLLNWLIDKNSKVSFGSLFIFIFAMLYGCFPKAVYAPLMLMFLFVPRDRFKDRKQEILLKVGVVVVCLLLLSTFILPTITNTMEADARGGNTSVSDQISLILNNPIAYLRVLKDTMIYKFIPNLLGKDIIFSYSYIGIGTDNLYLIFISFMLFVLFTDNGKNSLKIRDKIILGVGIIGVILLIWTALYLAFTPVGLNVINGVQPRYFIPLLLPIFYIFKNNKIKNSISGKVYNLLVISIPAIILFISLYQLFILNYCM